MKATQRWPTSSLFYPVHAILAKYNGEIYGVRYFEGMWRLNKAMTACSTSSCTRGTVYDNVLSTRFTRKTSETPVIQLSHNLICATGKEIEKSLKRKYKGIKVFVTKLRKPAEFAYSKSGYFYFKIDFADYE